MKEVGGRDCHKEHLRIREGTGNGVRQISAERILIMDNGLMASTHTSVISRAVPL